MPPKKMTSLPEMIQQQQTHIASLERQLSALREFVRSPPLAAVLEARSKILMTTWSSIQDLHLRIVSGTSEEDRQSDYFTQEEYTTAEALFFEGNDILATLQADVPPSPRLDFGTLQPRGLHHVDHLPKISLPTFAGDYTDWAKYRAYFESLIINNAYLDQLQKLHYLLSSLSGEPRNLLRNTSFSPESFDTAWTLLRSRYDNTRAIVSAHLKTLFSIPQVKPDSLDSLRTLRNRYTEAISALENEKRFAHVTTPAQVGTPGVHGVSDILVSLVTDRLDDATRKAWELHLGYTNEFPHFSRLDKFLAARIRGLEACSKSKGSNIPVGKRTEVHSKTPVHAVSTLNCPVCTQSHSVYKCNIFKSLSPANRVSRIKELKLCLNCLGSRHRVSQCGSTFSCSICKGRHHTMLHLPSATLSQAGSSTQAPVISTQSGQEPLSENLVQSHLVAPTLRSSGHVLLATAHVCVSAPSQRVEKIRALLDQGSTRTFITRDLVRILRLRTVRVANSLVGIGGASAGVAECAAEISIGPKHGNGPVILHPSSGLPLADDHPDLDEPVHMIIGADVYGQLLLNGIVRGKPCEPIAQNTVLGWILSGPSTVSSISADSSTPVHLCNPVDSLQKSLTRFWELETCPTVKILTPEDAQCESHFKTTHSRTPDGRYVVRIPFKTGPPISIGCSRYIALRLADSLARKFSRYSELKIQYSAFMSEYEDLGHMIKVDPPLQEHTQIVYLPHHPVFKTSSSTTKLRVVFNASSLTSNYTSLNSHVLVGPKLQPELLNILAQWRAYRFVFCADMTKMYRQILVHPLDQDYQRILWRSHPDAPLEEYKLLTLTYGTACAPYLALRTIQQLMIDEGDSFPLGKQILERFIYIDDCLFGANDRTRILQMRQEVCALLARAHFILRKWGSNEKSLLVNVAHIDHGLAWSQNDSESPEIKLLGLSWKPESDAFTFEVNIPPLDIVTKRTVLFIIARLFDPLGWISPVIVRAKMFIQELSRSELTWDEPLSQALSDQWQDICDDLPAISQVTINRWTQQQPGLVASSLHGFSDASNSAYGAVVYIRCVHRDGHITVSMLASKTRVAPIRTRSIPQLELCGALVLAELMLNICTIPEYADLERCCWTDASIVLAWLSREPYKRDVFIANRVSKIQTLLPDVPWRHVPTSENPADLASRGVAAKELATSSLWWSGPSWLAQSQMSWPPNLIQFHGLNSGEQADVEQVCHVTDNPLLNTIVSRASSWPKLVRITAYIRRWLKFRCSTPQDARSNMGSIDAQEYQDTECFIFHELQRLQFPIAILNLTTNIPLVPSDPLLALDPFLDANGLMRVGGRLVRSNLEYTVKHPVILKDHPAVRLLVSYAHERCLHGGLQLTLRTLRQQVWILRARILSRSVIAKCITCARLKADIATQLMGVLPPVRVNRPEKPFHHCGLDYAGPLSIRESRGRGKRSHPAYVALFICMAVRAVHLELVMDYSSEAFLAAFKRFVARRGLPFTLYSDRGTTFRGAHSELQRMFNAATLSSMFKDWIAVRGVNWHFIPPGAPHFGGLWEAGIRSVKHHLRRILRSHTPTIEELTTLLCQIEACLNSRPLGALRDNPDDLTALTPGHFLVGGELTAIPEPSLLRLNSNRLSRWQSYQQCLETFWKRWSLDYITSLQERTKWRLRTDSIRIGQMVLLKRDNLPPTKWQLGRVIECHPGSDDLVRVVIVRTATATLERPLSKIALLPLVHDDDGS